MGNMRDVLLGNRKKLHDNSKGFYCTFKVSLHNYFDIITGFEITKFEDEVIKSAPNISMKDAVLSEYGQEGVDIIVKLIARR